MTPPYFSEMLSVTYSRKRAKFTITLLPSTRGNTTLLKYTCLGAA